MTAGTTTTRKTALIRAWALTALGLVAAALVVASVAMGSARVGNTASAEPTPCPDAIACHALKRMPTAVVRP